MKGGERFVQCLEAEGVRHVFGIPGEETLDLNQALDASEIEFVPVRHEQGGAYIADVYGELTRPAGPPAAPASASGPWGRERPTCLPASPTPTSTGRRWSR